MADYIKLDEMLSQIKICDKELNETNFTTGSMYYRLVDRLLGIPAADVVEVVRCRDCKHYKPNPSGTIGRCDWSDMFPKPDNYCGYAKRKEHNDAERTD